MNKLILLVDEWERNKNFVERELTFIKEHFDVTIICNFDAESRYPSDTKYISYKRRIGINVIIAFMKCILDKTTWFEIFNLKKEKEKIKKISEVLRFYINAELFWNSVKDEFQKNEEFIVYSYWLFWKCFAFTKNKTKYPGMKIISRVHGYDLYDEQIPSGYQPFKRAMDERLDKVVFISEYGMNYYMEKYGLSNDNKHCLYQLGTKDHHILNPYKRMEGIRLVSCSNVIPIKRVDLIVKALSEVKNISIEWIHFGDGELLEKIKSDAEKLLKPCKNISYSLVGRVQNNDIMKYYSENSVDAFLMVSESEGNPVPVMEAMSFGIPIISYDICNMSNIVKGCGILIPENATYETLSKSIKEFAREEDEVIAEYRRRSREIWEKEFRGDENSKRFIDEVLLAL